MSISERKAITQVTRRIINVAGRRQETTMAVEQTHRRSENIDTGPGEGTAHLVWDIGDWDEKTWA